ncbi:MULTISPECIES: FMN-binding glutamate synthase family protein [Legionella]|uniref:FMN-binding glutamate synthase family protein n=1 Tax=Legionella resiliens TaxID=2905958 RepID=A0ABS8X1W4_9GAMM|nr:MULTISPECIES: FMN-binding glutamate synthase family protein [unclassified Legionella]MCE0723574.1 FMN-binding glutamate synthase family protein [Legionella sp. 9fVS26]MCE3532728.1 FMN-binding glutamate synthase family protein [Legionella sp. 8cVS16]QLZ68863.1 FMN-binding glutamate synthase family protein [Legionella sp. PC1000]
MKESYFHFSTTLGLLFASFLVFLIFLGIWNIFQTKHTILRNFPLIGYVRYISESLGVYLRHFFFTRDREELPFNRTERTWIYEASKNTDTTIGFGTTRARKPNTIYFVDSPFPVLKRYVVKAHSVTIGIHCKYPYTTNSLINISAMSHGSISQNAILALSHGAKKAGCWLNTGEGGLSPYHLAGGCDLIAQIGSAKYGYHDEDGNLSDEKLKEAAAHPQVKMFEIKLSQGSKPGRGGILPAVKVTKEIAKIRGIKPHEDSISPNRFPEISNSSELLNLIHHVREITGKPTGFKVVLGDYEWLDELCEEIIKRGLEYAPDFITLDGAEGGTGASPLTLADYMGLSLRESLPVLVDKLVEYDLRDRIKVIASGKLITPGMVAWALCVGADFVNSARGFMFALGCVQALRCHKNTCPTGITTHNKWLTRGLNPKNKAVRVYHYVKNLTNEVGIICHSCGVEEPRELRRHHARIVSEHGTSVSLADIYPSKEKGSKTNKKQKS